MRFLAALFAVMLVACAAAPAVPTGEGLAFYEAMDLGALKIQAKAGEPTARYYLAHRYKYRGGGISYKNHPLADKIFTELRLEMEPRAENGDATAQLLLGLIYDFGHAVEPDTARAMGYYKNAAQLGNADAIRILDERSKLNCLTCR